ncbi:MAG: hypothetical protein ACREEM_29490 [Blastocatellia bacterium]
MHDLDRTQLEADQFEYGFGFESGMYGEADMGSPFSEAEVMGLASELLGVTNEAELDQFLGNLFRRGAQAVGGFLRSPTGQALGGMVKDVARQALPTVGRAVGARFGGAAGGDVGGQIASRFGSLFGLELEGMNQEDQEFEAAQKLVRVAGAAAADAAAAPPTASPEAAAKAALMTAAKQFAPGLLRLLGRLRSRLGRMPGIAGGGTPFSEAEEMELTTELLGATTEAELDQFLGNLIRRGAQLVGRGAQAAGTFMRSPTGQALGGVLKGAAKQALPMLGTAAGSYFGGPAGGAIGGQLASGLGSLFGLELEGLSQEDQEFEAARQFVRFGGTAAANAAAAPTTASPQATANSAAAAAAQQYAPGLLRPSGPFSSGFGKGRSGRWERRGNQIILHGA